MHYKYPDVDRLTQWLIDNKNALDGELEITEKLDGANFSFYKSNGEAIWRSRSGIIKPENLNSFREAIEFVSPIVAKLKDNEVIFGENVAKHHRIKYNDDRHAFYAFGIYDINAGAFMNNWRRRCKNLGLPTVQVIKHDELTMESLLELRSGSSMIGESREGIVLKNYQTQAIYKLVDPKFEESHTQKPQREKIPIHEETQNFVNMHCTENRVIKAILRLHDEQGEALDMPMMGILPNAVAFDIYKECEVPKTINEKQLRKLVADISRETLKKYLNGEIE